MANLRIIKRRIKSISGIRQITRAMEMVSATKLKKALARVEQAKPYLNQMDSVFFHLIQSIDLETCNFVHPFMKKKEEEGDILLVIIGSDKGLCGSYITNILRESWKFINEKHESPLRRRFEPYPGEVEATLSTPSGSQVAFKGIVDNKGIVRAAGGHNDINLEMPGNYRCHIMYKTSGKPDLHFEINLRLKEKIHARTVKRSWAVENSLDYEYKGSLKLTRILNDVNIISAKINILPVGKKVNDAFMNVKNPRIRLLEPEINFNQAIPIGELNRFTNKLNEMFLSGAVSQIYLIYTEYIKATKQEPKTELYLPLSDLTKKEPEKNFRDYIFEPSPETLFDSLIPAYARLKIFRALANSFSSEHSIRMASMHNATENASKLIETLTLARNKARQAAITKELSEIIGGVEALKG